MLVIKIYLSVFLPLVQLNPIDYKSVGLAVKATIPRGGKGWPKYVLRPRTNYRRSKASRKKLARNEPGARDDRWRYRNDRNSGCRRYGGVEKSGVAGCWHRFQSAGFITLISVMDKWPG